MDSWSQKFLQGLVHKMKSRVDTPEEAAAITYASTTNDLSRALFVGNGCCIAWGRRTRDFGIVGTPHWQRFQKEEEDANDNAEEEQKDEGAPKPKPKRQRKTKRREPRPEETSDDEDAGADTERVGKAFGKSGDDEYLNGRFFTRPAAHGSQAQGHPAAAAQQQTHPNGARTDSHTNDTNNDNNSASPPTHTHVDPPSIIKG